MTFPTVYNPKLRGSRPKYGNKKVTVDGIKFDSKWESQRYMYLKSLERADQVKDLELQVRYNIAVNGEKICAYVADFRYQKQDKNGDWYEVVEDAKGVETPEFKLKKKLMKVDLKLSEEQMLRRRGKSVRINGPGKQLPEPHS